jgi:hypothetical protein
LRGIPFSNPNQLEDALARRSHQFAETHPWLITSISSLAFCIPCNRVQSEYLNRAGTASNLSSDALAREYANGRRVRIEDLANYIPQSCHEEVDLPLERISVPVADSQLF